MGYYNGYIMGPNKIISVHDNVRITKKCFDDSENLLKRLYFIKPKYSV